MARLPYLEKNDLAAEDQHLLDRPGNVASVILHSPKLYAAMMGIGRHLRHRSRLDTRLREMAILQVAVDTGSAYEWVHHLKIRDEFGVTDDDVRGLIAKIQGRPNQLDALTSAVLVAAHEITVDISLSNSSFNTIKHSLDNEQLLDLIGTIGYYNSLSRILGAFKVDIEDDCQHYLAEFPMPVPAHAPARP